MIRAVIMWEALYLYDISDLSSYHWPENPKLFLSLLVFRSLFKRVIFILSKYSFFVVFAYSLRPLL